MAIARYLTPREIEVTELVHAGHTYGEIGKKLGLSPQTVKQYMQRVFGKLQIEGSCPRQQLVLMMEREKAAK